MGGEPRVAHGSEPDASASRKRYEQLTSYRVDALKGLIGGQGRDRTADLPLFRRTLVPTELPAQVGSSKRADHAVPTGFDPATSALTGRRALRAAPRDLRV